MTPAQRRAAYLAYADEARRLADAEKSHIIRQRLIAIAKSWIALAAVEDEPAEESHQIKT